MADEIVRIKFDGGIASEGQLDFYEFSRSQYGLARFLATIEHYRRTGKVAARINAGSYIELRIFAPRQGSFIQEVLVQTAAGVCTAGFLALLAYIWHIISPRREKTDETLLEIARTQLQVERERTKQLQHIKEIAEGERASAAQAIELIKWSLALPDDIQASLTATNAERRDQLREVEAEQQRENEFSESESELSDLDENTLNKLASRIRPMVSEIALPLRSSATRMSIGADRPKHQRLMHLNQDIVRLVQGRKTEKHLTTIIGRIKAYDRDSGVGKVQSRDLPRVLNFVVPQNLRVELRDSILEAMTRNFVELKVRRILDESGEPTSLILVQPIDTATSYYEE